MNIDINIADFLTEDHKKNIQLKLTEAINSISAEDIKIEILANFEEYNLTEIIAENILDNISYEKIHSIIDENVLKAIKNTFKDE